MRSRVAWYELAAVMRASLVAPKLRGSEDGPPRRGGREDRPGARNSVTGLRTPMVPKILSERSAS